MFKFLKTFRLRKKEIEGSIIPPINEEPPFDINIDKTEHYTKITISDYISSKLYVTKIKESPLPETSELSMNILWNSDKQKINKGTFYIYRQNNHLYNILINDNKIIIDERIYYEDKTDERIIKFNTETSNFNFSSLKHDSIGSTYHTKFYSKNKTQFLGLVLSKEEAASEINPLFERIELLDSIESIIPLDLIKNQVLNHVNNPDTNRIQK